MRLTGGRFAALIKRIGTDTVSTEVRSSLVTPKDREWIGLGAFLVLIFLVDRLSNIFLDFRQFDTLIYLIAVLSIGCWAGFRSALGSCLALFAYAWIIFHFYPISAVARDPKYLKPAVIFVAILFPPFAIVGGFVNLGLRRARAEVEREGEQRRLAQAELWASEEMQRVIVRSSLDAVIGIGSNMKISLWSPNAEKLFGWPRAEAIGSPAARCIVALMPDADGDGDVFLLEQIQSPESQVLRREFETTATTRSGDEISVEFYIVDHPTETGPMYLMFARDISRRKHAEQLVHELNASLEERVAQRTEQLEAANDELLGFTYSVSHDLRAPLRAMVTNSRIVCEEAKGILSESLFERLQRLDANAMKMGQLIDNLLQYSRIGRVSMASREVDLSAMANRIVEDLKLLREGSVKVQPGIVVQGDPQMLEMVLVNLLENAWKYVEPKASPKVEVGTTPDGAIYVRDYGIGFDMQYADKVWEPFERLHNDREYPGTGIGLANSRRIVQRHGGRIWTESALGVGTTMYFNLGSPAVPCEEKLPNPRRAKAKAR